MEEIEEAELSDEEGIRNVIQDTQNPQRLTTMGHPAETDENLWNADIDESQVEDSPIALKKATPHGESRFHKREKSMADRQSHVNTDKKTEMKLDWQSKEKQFKESWKNDLAHSVSAIDKVGETSSKQYRSTEN